MGPHVLVPLRVVQKLAEIFDKADGVQSWWGEVVLQLV